MIANIFMICSRRGCRWGGFQAQQKLVPHPTFSNASTYVCPKCGCNSFYDEKPLFIPLKREFFEAFKAGTKTEEYRPHGTRWNSTTCRIGRRVTLSLGYGKAHRLHGVVTGFRLEHDPAFNLKGWVKCYGDRHAAAACIGLKLDALA